MFLIYEILIFLEFVPTWITELCFELRQKVQNLIRGNVCFACLHILHVKGTSNSRGLKEPKRSRGYGLTVHAKVLAMNKSLDGNQHLKVA
jgi:hypothetical protein